MDVPVSRSDGDIVAEASAHPAAVILLRQPIRVCQRCEECTIAVALAAVRLVDAMILQHDNHDIVEPSVPGRNSPGIGDRIR